MLSTSSIFAISFSPIEFMCLYLNSLRVIHMYWQYHNKNLDQISFS